MEFTKCNIRKISNVCIYIYQTRSMCNVRVMMISATYKITYNIKQCCSPVQRFVFMKTSFNFLANLSRVEQKDPNFHATLFSFLVSDRLSLLAVESRITWYLPFLLLLCLLSRDNKLHRHHQLNNLFLHAVICTGLAVSI